MSSKIDLATAETWCSKLCHDLVSPVGAVCNGVEFLQESGAAGVDEAADLIALSANMAADRLRFYRTAYGASGAQATMSLGEAAQTANAYLKWTKVKMSIPEDRRNAVLPVGYGKIFLNLVALVEHAMVYGGEIAVSVEIDAGGEVESLSMDASGRAVKFAHGEPEMLAGEVDEQDVAPRSVHAYMTGLFLRRLGKTARLDTVDETRLVIQVQ